MAFGYGKWTEKPFRYRIVMPWLVAHVPGAVVPDHSYWPLVIRWVIVAGVALTIAGVALYTLLRTWGASEAAALVGVCAWYLSHPVLMFAGIPLIESAAFAVLIVAMLAAERGWWPVFAATVAVGMFVKETTVLALVYPLVMARPWGKRLTMAALAVPGVAAYAVYRLVIDPFDKGYTYTATAWIGNIRTLLTPGEASLIGWRDILFSLGVLWVPLAVGLWRGNGLVPRRYAWFVGVTAFMPFVLTTDKERIIFLAFPVALGFGLPTMTRLLLKSDGRTADTAPSAPAQRQAPADAAVDPLVAASDHQ
jgi:hypothetical protein